PVADRGRGVAVPSGAKQGAVLERGLLAVAEHGVALEPFADRVPGVARVVRRRRVPAVAAERLVRPLAGEHHLEEAARFAREREHRQEGRVAVRLFGMADRAGELRKELVARPQDVQGEPELARDLRRARRLVELGAVETDRAGSDLADRVEDRRRRRDEVEAQVVVERAQVHAGPEEPGSEETLHLGTEDDALAVRVDEERLLPEAIAREDEPPALAIEQGDR